MVSTPAPAVVRCTGGDEQTRVRPFRHNPYAFSVLSEKDRNMAAVSFIELYNNCLPEVQANGPRKVMPKLSGGSTRASSSCPTPLPAVLEVTPAATAAPSVKSPAAESGNDDGVSETSSESGSGDRSNTVKDTVVGFSVTGSRTLPATAAPSVIRYASVNFRFGSAWFVAPFRTFAGEMVVVQYPGANHSLHMGLVSSVTTAKPITFYTEDNMDSNYLSAEELEAVPRLLRHARDFDKETKLDLRNHDIRAILNARKLATEMGVPVQFLDAEWLLDLSAVTFLVSVFGDRERVDQLVDALAVQEGAEVVFTYPVSASMY